MVIRTGEGVMGEEVGGKKPFSVYSIVGFIKDSGTSLNTDKRWEVCNRIDNGAEWQKGRSMLVYCIKNII